MNEMVERVARVMPEQPDSDDVLFTADCDPVWRAMVDAALQDDPQ